MSKDFLADSRPSLPPVLTSYDFLKAAALLLMIIDHVGYYFFPDEFTWRVIGRFSAPIWLFLVGYARSRDLSGRLWLGMGILVLSNYVVGMPVLPLNILATILMCRMAIDPIMDFVTRNPKALYPVTILLFVGTILASSVTEYGTASMLIVMSGYMVRHRESLPFGRSDILQFVCVAGILYAFIQAVSFFSFPMYARMGLAVGIMGLLVFLTRFRPYEYPGLTAALPRPVSGLIRLAGRRTLEFYVLHLLLFKALAFYLGTHKMALFSFHIFQN